MKNLKIILNTKYTVIDFIGIVSAGIFSAGFPFFFLWAWANGGVI